MVKNNGCLLLFERFLEFLFLGFSVVLVIPVTDPVMGSYMFSVALVNQFSYMQWQEMDQGIRKCNQWHISGGWDGILFGDITCSCRVLAGVASISACVTYVSSYFCICCYLGVIFHHCCYFHCWSTHSLLLLFAFAANSSFGHVGDLDFV